MNRPKLIAAILVSQMAIVNLQAGEDRLQSLFRLEQSLAAINDPEKIKELQAELDHKNMHRLLSQAENAIEINPMQDEQRRKLMQEIETLRARANQAAQGSKEVRPLIDAIQKLKARLAQSEN